MLTVRLFSPNMPLGYTIHNNDPSSQGVWNPLAKNCGTFIYAHIQQPFLCYLLTLKGRPCRFSVPTTSQVWRPWSGTSMQQQASQYKTLGSVLLKMVIPILCQDSPMPMLLIFFCHWTKPSWDIFFRLDRACNQQNTSRITNHMVT